MAVNEATVKGNWNELKGRLRQRWGQLSDNELEAARGSIDRLVGAIQRQTGESQQAVRQYVEKVVNELEPAAESAAETIRQYGELAAEKMQEAAHKVTETVQASSHQAMDQARAGYIQAERMVRNRPVESLLVCFGTGLITGVVLGLVLRSK